MISRIFVYLIQSFQLSSRIILTLLVVSVVHFSLRAQFQPQTFAATFCAMFFSLLYYRISDELKDLNSDKIFFPNRPLAAGKVLSKDLQALRLLSALILITSLSFVQNSLFYGITLIIFLLLIQFNYFISAIIEKSKVRSFAASSPFILFLNVYLISLTIAKNEAVLNFENIALALCLSMPVYHWEVMRKTSLMEKPGYQTFSSTLTYQGAILLAIGFLVPLILGLRITLDDQLFYPLLIIIIAYSLYLWGLGLKNTESLIKGKTLSEWLYIICLAAILYQKLTF